MFSRITTTVFPSLWKKAGGLTKTALSSMKSRHILINQFNYGFSTVAAYAVYKQNTAKLTFQEKEQRALKNLKALSLQEAVALVWEGAETQKGSNLLWTNLEEKLLPEVSKMSEIDLALTIWGEIFKITFNCLIGSFGKKEFKRFHPFFNSVL